MDQLEIVKILCDATIGNDPGLDMLSEGKAGPTILNKLQLAKKIMKLSKQEKCHASEKKKEWPQEGDVVYTIINKGSQVVGHMYPQHIPVDAPPEYEWYRTKEYASWMLRHKRALAKLRKIAERDYEASKIDWQNSDILKYFLTYNNQDDDWSILEWRFAQATGLVYFYKKPDLDKILFEMNGMMRYLLWEPEMVDDLSILDTFKSITTL